MPAAALRNAFGALALAVSALSANANADDSSWKALPYSLGEGLQLPQQQLVIGGYTSVYYSNLQHRDWELSARDISLFVSKSLRDRWHLFTEMEIGDAVQVTAHDVTTDAAEFDIERLYLDYRASRALNYRVGKYLTPVGRWNQIHADPLVWTADRPLTTAAPFARHGTGAMLYGNLATRTGSTDYKLYVDDSQSLDPWQQDEPAFEDDVNPDAPHNAFDWAVGGHAAVHLVDDSLHLGVSYVHFRMHDLAEIKNLYGADALFTVRGMEFSGELAYRSSHGGQENDEYGGFIQAVFPLPARLYLIGRHEIYRPAFADATARIETAGITWRPHHAVSLKLEYRNGNHNAQIAQDGWLGSLAILF